MDDAPTPARAPGWRWLSDAGPSVAAVVVMAACVGPLADQWRQGAWPPARAADAKPLYLSARAVALGADPVDPDVLQTLAGQAGMREGGGAGAVRRADPLRAGDKGGAFASMYPASAAVLLQVLRPEAWPDFVVRFRQLGLGLLVAGAAAAGAAGAGSRRTALLGAALGLGTVLAVAPPVSEALGVAQANVHVAGLTGLALGALAAGWAGLFGLLVVLGGGLKLLPLALLGPSVAGRWWRSGGVALVVGAGLLVAVASTVPLVDAVADVVESLRYQAAVAPKWVLRDAPRPAFLLFHLRQGPLGFVTAGLVLALVAPERARLGGGLRTWARGWLQHPTRRRELVAAAALTAAWMGVLGAGSQRIYAVLQVPGWAWVLGAAVAPVRSGAVRVAAVALALLVVGPAQLDTRGLAGWDGRAVVLLGAWLAWTAVAGRAVLLGWPGWGWMRRGGAVGLIGWLGGVAVWWSGLGGQG